MSCIVHGAEHKEKENLSTAKAHDTNLIDLLEILHSLFNTFSSSVLYTKSQQNVRLFHIVSF